MPQVSVILPTYNENENIADLIVAISGSVKQPLEIVVVDDNSPDKTWEIVSRMQADYPHLKLIRRMEKRGLATALADGVASSSGDILVWMDCDFSHPPALIPQMVDALNDYDIAISSRYVDGGGTQTSLLRTVTSRMFNLYANLFLGSYVKDWTSGFMVVRKEVLNTVKIMPLGRGYGEYFIALLYQAKKQGLKTKEIPYIYSYRQRNTTKTSPSTAKFLGYAFSYCWSVIYLRGKDILPGISKTPKQAACKSSGLKPEDS